MSYYIDIIDKESPDTKLDYRFASASGITLEWAGADAKDDVLIVGTNLKYDILTTTAEDLAFIEFFTGNENRFLVQVKKSSDDSVLWQGYLLPDQYSEPYKNGAFFVSFIASCGLGRLKGKYLPDEYYEREKSVIAILCQIIKMTNLGLDILFAPAIENAVQKDWNQIVLDTADFKEKEKKNDAYKILETLLKDKQCVVYQADNRWYIEGLNQRHLKEVLYKKYTENGVYVADVVFNRLTKKITALVEPTITVIPPYNEISVTHKKTAPELPKTIAKENNDGWAFVTGVSGENYSNDWVGHNGYYMRSAKPDYTNRLYTKSYEVGGGNINYPHDETKYVSLKQKLFIEKGRKISVKLDFTIPGDSLPSNFNLWKNPFKYEVVFNGVVVFTNWGSVVDYEQNLFFRESRSAKIEKDYVTPSDGLLDIKLWRPFGTDNTTRIYEVVVSEVKVTVNGFEEEQIEVDTINDEFTIDKEIELTYADDKTGFSKGFRLYKLKEETQYFTEIEVPILYAFVLNGKNYSVVSLPGAKLIKDNLYQLYYSGSKISVVDVVYNLNNNEQMVVQTNTLYSTGSFSVKKYAIDDNLASRDPWLKWTDSVYKIENNSYAKTVANIYRRMFSVAVEKLDLTALNAVKFNDIIAFKYVSDKEFFPLNVVWNLDENKSELRLARSFYKDSGSTPGDDNVPPIVLAGDDVFITDTQTTASLLATAYDPDGFIVSQNWTKLVGSFGDVIVSPNQLATELQNLTQDFYTYKIEVVDNNGATAFDTINIIRVKDYLIQLVLVQETIDSNVSHPSIVRKYELKFTPNLLTDFAVNVIGKIMLSSIVNGTFGVSGNAYYKFEKNGALIEENVVNNGVDYFDFILGFIATDQIFITLQTDAVAGDTGSGDNAVVTASIDVLNVEFVAGQGNIIGLPINKNQSVNVSS